MNILLSAYACEPNKGSEPGVGWSWALSYAKKHNVWVITRANNQLAIEAYLKDNTVENIEHVTFVYVDLPRKYTWWKKGRRGMRLYYALWQRKAFKAAQRLAKEIAFDFVQHVTFVSYTQPTYLYKLGIPLIWGPVSGGENIPEEITIKMNPRERLTELVRKCSQVTALWMPSIKNTMEKSTLILVTTEETKNRIPRKYANKTTVLPAIGVDRYPDKDEIEIRGKDIKKIVMAGRLIYWKAFDIGINAFLKIAEEYEDVELHVLGEGNQKEQLKKLAGRYFNKRIFFDGTVPHDEILNYYRQFDLFLNTTLRDSGCMTMMEALSVGIPCVALDTGGPRVLGQDNEAVELVPVRSYENTVQSVADKIRHYLNAECEVCPNTILKTSYDRKCEMICNLFGRMHNE